MKEAQERDSMKNQFDKKLYLELKGKCCPYCESSNLSYHDGFNYEGSTEGVYEAVQCDSCGKSWRDIFVLTDVEEIKD